MLLIFRHEFLHTIKRIGFIILTLALPVLALLAIGISHIASGVIKPPAEVTKIGYVDEAGGFEEFTSQGNITLVRFDTREAATQALTKKDISEFFVIPPDYISAGIIDRYTVQKEVTPPSATETAIKNFLTSNLLAGKVPVATIARIEAPLNLVTTTLTGAGNVATEQGGLGNLIIPGVFGFLLALALIFSSIYVLQALGEEKENRLMEILLSSVSTRQLMTGKVLGIGLAGLAQVAVWVVSIPLLLGLASSSIGGFISTIRIPANFLVLGVTYFFLGLLAVRGAVGWCRRHQFQCTRSPGISRDLYHFRNGPILVLQPDPVVSEQPHLGCVQHLPLLSPSVGNVTAWHDRCPGMATRRQHSCLSAVHRWWLGTSS